MPPVHPPSDLFDLPDLARREELRNARGLSEVADEHITVAGGFVGRSHPGSWLNQAAGVGYGVEVTRQDVERIIAFHQEVGAEPKIEVSPFCHPSLLRHVAELRFQISCSGFLGGFEHVLVRPIRADESITPAVPTPEGLELGAVDPSNAEQVREYALVAMSGFVPPGQP